MNEGINQDLIGLSLDGYTVRQMHEVFKADEDGGKTETKGYFRDANIAAAWAQGQTDASWHKTREVLVATNGQRFFLFTGQEIAPFSDERAALQVRETALAKLTEEERAVLGL